MSTLRIGIIVVALAAFVSPVFAQASRSAGAAARVAQLLQQRNLRHVAASDPGDPGRYVAAMRIGDTQLFVVSARYTQPVLLNERLIKNDHEGAYLELNSASVRDGKLFVQDLGAPGLHATRAADEAFDIVYESGEKRTVFDGDWKTQKLSKSDYEAAFTEADTRYAQALDRLIAALDGSAVRP